MTYMGPDAGLEEQRRALPVDPSVLREALDAFRMAATNVDLFSASSQQYASASASGVLQARVRMMRLMKRAGLLLEVVAAADAKEPEMTCMQRVTDYLWIGPYQPLLRRGEALTANGITAVLSVLKDPPNQLPSCVKRKLCLQVADHEGADMDFEKAVAFVREEKEVFGGRTFVHCGSGISRAATATIACLVEIEKISLADAIFWVKQVRPCINPNRGFRRQLQSRYAEQIAVAG